MNSENEKKITTSTKYYEEPRKNIKRYYCLTKFIKTI